MLPTGCVTDNGNREVSPARPAGVANPPDNPAERLTYLLHLAERSGGPDREKYRIQAAQLLLESGRLEEARNLLQGTDVAFLDNRAILDRQIQLGKLELRSFRPDRALEAIRSTTGLPATPDQLREAMSIQAEALEQLHRPVDAARQRLRLMELAGGDANWVRAQQSKILQSLVGLSSQAIDNHLRISPEGALAPWLELARLTRGGQNARQRSNAIDNWLLRYPQIPVDPGLFDQAVNPLLPTGRHPQRIAVLLPQRGDLGALAQRILDGLFTAYQLLPEPRPEINLYDSNSMDVVKLYSSAVADGAQLVIGPLQKSQVAALVRSGTVSVPTLMLNIEAREEAVKQPLIYQMALRPDDEIQQVLDLARSEGVHQAFLLYPDSDWGMEMRTKYREYWLQRGGVLVGESKYRQTDRDFATLLQSSFELNLSLARASKLERELATKLNFSPRIRQDMEAIFLVSLEEQSRLLLPQLKFHRAENLPVYSTSHVYSGISNPIGDKDLDGLSLCDASWIIEPGNPELPDMGAALADTKPGGGYPRLFALGVDALLVYPYLANLGQQRLHPFRGLTGALYLDEGQALRRVLPCARFSNGRLKTAALPNLR